VQESLARYQREFYGFVDAMKTGQHFSYQSLASQLPYTIRRSQFDQIARQRRRHLGDILPISGSIWVKTNRRSFAPR